MLPSRLRARQRTRRPRARVRVGRGVGTIGPIDASAPRVEDSWEIDASMTSRPATTVQPLKRDALRVDLALQGGGAHGAYTWGVVDRLLEEPWLRIEGISGTSAGAMN